MKGVRRLRRVRGEERKKPRAGWLLPDAAEGEEGVWDGGWGAGRRLKKSLEPDVMNGRTARAKGAPQRILH